MAMRLNQALPSGLEAVSAPGLLGRVYVGAPSDVHVAPIIRRHASHLVQAYVHRGIARLSESDRVLLVHYSERQTDFTKVFPEGAWVRIRHGEYVRDVARVHRSTSNSDVLELLVVPRIVNELEDVDLEPRKKSGRVNTIRTLQILEQISIVDLQPGPEEGTFLIKDAVFFRNGLRLLKVAGLHYAENCRPSAEELWLFTVAGLDTRRETNAAFLKVGDRVHVVRGEYGTEDGKVEKKEEDTAQVRMMTDDALLSVHFSELERVFKVGDAVSVCLGPFKGRSGLVVASFEGELTFVQFDSTEHVSYFLVLLNSPTDIFTYRSSYSQRQWNRSLLTNECAAFRPWLLCP